APGTPPSPTSAPPSRRATTCRGSPPCAPPATSATATGGSTGRGPDGGIAAVLTLGDNAYPDGSAGDYARCYGPTWGRPDIKSRTRPAPGNHEYGTQGAAGCYHHFRAAAGHPGQGLHP